MPGCQQGARVSPRIARASGRNVMMNKQFRHILVAVGDVQRPPKSELRKVAALARSSGANVEFFHATHEPDPWRSNPETATSEAVKKQRAEIVAKREATLQ